MQCTRCTGTGFLNLDQVDDDVLKKFDESGDHEIILDWLDKKEALLIRLQGCLCHIAPPCSYCMECHDVCVCDCCGDGISDWYGEPGQHYEKSGSWDHPYPGLPECY
jgi:hypothetical protein